MNSAQGGCSASCSSNPSRSPSSAVSTADGGEVASVKSWPCALLPTLLSRGEGFSICTHLRTTDVAQLVCVSSVVGSVQARENVWRALFVLRWGPEQGVSHTTKVIITRSWVEETWPGPWPLTVGFCGARSSLDHLFWFLPMIRCMVGIEKPRSAPPPPLPASLTWQVVCRVRMQPHGSGRLARCFLCDVMEVSPPGPSPQHFRQRWGQPCSCCQRLAHRSCLEHLLLAATPEAITGRLRPRSGVNKNRNSMMSCGTCGQEYRLTRRFPESTRELFAATIQEWRWVLRRIFTMLVFLFWLHALAEHYIIFHSFGNHKRPVIVMTACMMSISVCQRFHRGVQMIWHTPHRWHYLKLFVVIAILVYLAVLGHVDPSRIRPAFPQWLWIDYLHKAHLVAYGSVLGNVFLVALSCIYVGAASGLIFCFWKTSLRVPTIADVGHGAVGSLKRNCSKCGLCQLGLCLDNTSM